MIKIRLNPYSNGICSMSEFIKVQTNKGRVVS